MQDLFPGRLISRSGDVSSSSSELTASDFLLWGYLKVYVDKLRTMQQLKNNIWQEIINIPVEMYKK